MTALIVVLVLLAADAGHHIWDARRRQTRAASMFRHPAGRKR